MSTAFKNLRSRLLEELEIELTRALLCDRAIGRELAAVLDQLATAPVHEQAWLLALDVGRWRDWNRANPRTSATTTNAPAPVTDAAA